MTTNKDAGASGQTHPAANDGGGFTKDDTPTLSLEQLKAVAHGAAIPVAEPVQSPDDSPSRSTQRDRLILAANAHSLWTDSEGNAYATITRHNGTEQHLKIRTSKYKRILISALYAQTGSGCSSQAVEEALATLEAKAQASGTTHEPCLRVARHEQRIYIDLADEHGSVIEVTPEGWGLCARPPVKFVQRKSMLALPMPIETGTKNTWTAFSELFGVTGDAEMLLFGWILSAWRGAENYAVLSILAQQGCGKSTLMRAIKRLVDPGKAELLNQPKDERDLFISAHNSHAIFYDNISTLPSWRSDGFCKLSTGASFSTRTLHSNDEETLFSAARPVAFNGIADCASRPDLQSRLISIELTEPAKRKTEEQIWRKFDDLRPGLLGFMLTVISKALSIMPELAASVVELPRMADVYLWMLACATAAGYSPDRFKQAYAENQKNGALIALESSPLAEVVMRGVESGELIFHDTKVRPSATAMLGYIKNIAHDDERRALPKCGKTLVDALNRLAPALRSIGIYFEKGKSNGVKYVCFTKADVQKGCASLKTKNGENPELTGVLRGAQAGSQEKAGSQSGAQQNLNKSVLATSLKEEPALSFEPSGSIGSQRAVINPNEVPW